MTNPDPREHPLAPPFSSPAVEAERKAELARAAGAAAETSLPPGRARAIRAVVEAKRARDLRDDRRALGRRHRTAAEPLLQALAAEQRHHDVRAAVGVGPEVVDLDDARVIDRRGGARLVEEALDDRRVARELRQQHLDRRRPAELDVIRPVDHPHAAPPQLGDDPIVAHDLTDHAS